MKRLPIINEEEKKRILSLHTEVLNEDMDFLYKLKRAFDNLLPGNNNTSDEIVKNLSNILGKDTKSIEDVIFKTPEMKNKLPIGNVSAKGQKLLENPRFNQKLSDISNAIDIDEDSIIKLMKHESGLDPTIKNSIGCVGLIQFCPDGGSTKRIAGKTYSMDELRYNLDTQMEAIKKFWLSGYNSGKIKEPADLYIYNFFPIAAGKPDDFVLKTKGLSARKIAISNPVFNRVLGRPKGHPLTVGDLKRYYKMTGMV